MLGTTKEGLILLLIIIVCWFTTQIIKLFFTKKFNLKDFLFGTGGMPSSHAASVVSLPTFVFLNWGINVIFVITLALSILTLRDAMGVRYAVGKNAKVLEKIATNKQKLEIVFSNGHNLKEVIAGILVGLIVTTLLYIWLI
jgi:uncharacterized protein